MALPASPDLSSRRAHYQRCDHLFRCDSGEKEIHSEATERSCLGEEIRIDLDGGAWAEVALSGPPSWLWLTLIGIESG